MSRPRHIAVIPDGNRRWAKTRGLNPWEGHKEGVKRFVEITNAVFRLNIPHFTFWAASKDNLVKRNPLEVKFLATLLRRQLKLGLEPFEQKDIRLRVLGRGRQIIGDPGLSRTIDEFEDKSACNSKYNLTVCFGYDGMEEVVAAVKDVASAKPDMITGDTIKNALWSAGLPSVDLVIRTGETDENWFHNSAGFMMWLSANSEFYFPKVFWPDFTVAEFKKALGGYAKRQRRFGA